MAFAKVHSAQTVMLDAHIIDVEVDLSRGLHSFAIVGLPDKAVEEARDRISAALKNSKLASPKHTNQKVVVSLAPANLKKEGATFDLAIALAYLVAAGELAGDFSRSLFLGELSLDGELRSVRGVLPLVAEAKKHGFKEVFVPRGNAREAALIKGIAIYGADTLADVAAHLSEQETELEQAAPTPFEHRAAHGIVDFADVRGQESAKRGIEIAAAGGHNILLWGPPGAGKTLLARALAGILPTLSFDEALEVTGIHSVAGTLHDDLVTHPPFRAPHHTASYTALVGGGTVPRPGEITLAHRGVLFLDEFPEFDRRVIEVLRGPLEDKTVSVARVRGSAVFPANVTLVAAMNPCPCGNFESDTSTGLGTGKPCVCPPNTVERYQRKVSGPILDRIDVRLRLGAVDVGKLGRDAVRGESTAAVAKRVAAARERQRARFVNTELATNSDMGVKELEKFAPLAPGLEQLLEQSARTFDMTARGYHKVVKLARTIADLADSDAIEEPHLLEALQYRNTPNKT